jgi:hypothetical protein
MPIDAGIYAQQQQQPSILKGISDAMIVRGQQQAQQINAVKLEEDQRALAAQKQIDEAYAHAIEIGPDGQPKVNQAKLFSYLPGHAIPGALKAQQEFQEAVAKITKLNAEAQITKSDAAGVIINGVKDHGYDPKSYTIGIRALFDAGVITQEQATQYQISGDNDPTKIKSIVDDLAARSKTAAETNNIAAQAKLRAAQTPGAIAKSESEQKIAAGTSPEGITAEQAAQSAAQARAQAELARHNVETEKTARVNAAKPSGVALPVVIQTSDGPQLLDRRTATTTPITSPTGAPVQPAPTADMRNKVAARELVAKSIQTIETLGDTIITRIGPGQRAAAIARGASAVFGNDPQFRTYQDARMALAGNLAVGQQGSRPSDADIKAIWLPLVPDAYRDTKESAAMKWTLIKTMSNAPMESVKGASPAGADAYEQYLQRTQPK